MHHDGLHFDRPVPSGGYAWWYLDGLSEDGRHGITVIAFLGSVFSPYYAWARRRGLSDPLNHCAINVAVYGPRSSRWSMTERGSDDVIRDRFCLSIGTSALQWNGAALDISIDEICAPLPRRVRGSIRLTPTGLHQRSYLLDGDGRHAWTPFAPSAHIDVHLLDPAIHWTGPAYFDSNFGEDPLEDAFQRWTWSRASLPTGTVVLYDVAPRASPEHSLALRFDRSGASEFIECPPTVALPSTGWHIARQTRADHGHDASVVKTLEDAPFYSRSLLRTHLGGTTVSAIHESLDLDRFRSRWVKCLLPFKMPRRFY